jgi:hypothetical protein
VLSGTIGEKGDLLVKVSVRYGEILETGRAMTCSCRSKAGETLLSASERRAGNERASLPPHSGTWARNVGAQDVRLDI